MDERPPRAPAIGVGEVTQNTEEQEGEKIVKGPLDLCPSVEDPLLAACDCLGGGRREHERFLALALLVGVHPLVCHLHEREDVACIRRDLNRPDAQSHSGRNPNHLR